MGFSDILSSVVLPAAKLILGNETDQYSPYPKSENPYRECLYRTLDTLDGELIDRKREKQQEQNNKNDDIPSRDMIFRKLQQTTNNDSTYNKISNTSYKWSCKI